MNSRIVLYKLKHSLCIAAEIIHYMSSYLAQVLKDIASKTLFNSYNTKCEMKLGKSFFKSICFQLATCITFFINSQCELIAKMKETFVLIKCESGYEAGVIRELQEIEQVTEIRRIIGEYDLLVRLELPNESKAYETANKKILDMNQVSSISALASMVREST